MLVTVQRNDNDSFTVKSEAKSYIVAKLNEQSHWGAWNEGEKRLDSKTIAEAPTSRDMIGWLILDLTN